MTMPTQGLRERKKARTQRAIQDAALRLFVEQGYDGTTIEQIAAAAEVSPATFFRYFPTKEDVVVLDEYDPMFIEGIKRQPAELSPMEAVRQTFMDVVPLIDNDDRGLLLTRSRLIFGVPALRGRALVHMLDTQCLIAEAIAERMDRDPHDMRIRRFAGALLGALTAAYMTWMESGGEQPLDELCDESLTHLADGLPL